MNQKRKIGKRIAAWLLCMVMMLSIMNLPGFTTTVHAALTANVQISDAGIVTWDAFGDTGIYRIEVSNNSDGSGIITKVFDISTREYNLKARLDELKIATHSYYVTIYTNNGGFPVNSESVIYEYASTLPKLSEPQNLKWDGTAARWDSVPNATRYNVTLKDSTGSSVRTVTTDNTYYDFGNEAKADRWFEVVAVTAGYRDSNAGESPKLETYAIYVYGGYSATDNTGETTISFGAPGQKIYIFPETSDGQLFESWTVNSPIDLTISSSHPASFIMPEEKVTVTAVYKDAVTISFDANGGTGAMSSVTVGKGETYILPNTCEFTAPKGKKFGNQWIMSMEGASVTLPVGYPLNAVASLTLQPVWVYDYYTFDKENGVLTIVGAMPEMEYDEFPWYEDRDLIKEVVVEEGVTSIASNAFADCKNLTKVTLPSTLTSMSDAFKGSGITSITIPEGVTEIPAWAFYRCNSLTEIKLPSTIKNIGSMALYVDKPALVTIKYNGAEADWAKVNIDSSNNIPKQGMIIYKHDHIGGTATCTKKAICTICGEEYGELESHDFSVQDVTKATLTASGKIVTKCKDCGEVSATKTISYPKTIKLSATSYTYDGKAKKPTVSVVAANGKEISSTNYTVTYASGRKNVGKYTVKVAFKGNYSDTKSLTFKINPVKTSIKTLTKGTKSFKVTWAKKSTQVTGYQIQYSLKSDFSSGNKTMTVKSYKTTAKTIKNLKAKKKYYVRVRTYKTVSGTNYYSGWSAKKYVTTK